MVKIHRISEFQKNQKESFGDFSKNLLQIIKMAILNELNDYPFLKRLLLIIGIHYTLETILSLLALAIRFLFDIKRNVLFKLLTNSINFFKEKVAILNIINKTGISNIFNFDNTKFYNNLFILFTFFLTIKSIWTNFIEYRKKSKVQKENDMKQTARALFLKNLDNLQKKKELAQKDETIVKDLIIWLNCIGKSKFFENFELVNAALTFRLVGLKTMKILYAYFLKQEQRRVKFKKADKNNKKFNIISILKKISNICNKISLKIFNGFNKIFKLFKNFLKKIIKFLMSFLKKIRFVTILKSLFLLFLILMLSGRLLERLLAMLLDLLYSDSWESSRIAQAIVRYIENFFGYSDPCYGFGPTTPALLEKAERIAKSKPLFPDLSNFYFQKKNIEFKPLNIKFNKPVINTFNEVKLLNLNHENSVLKPHILSLRPTNNLSWGIKNFKEINPLKNSAYINKNFNVGLNKGYRISA